MPSWLWVPSCWDCCWRGFSSAFVICSRNSSSPTARVMRWRGRCRVSGRHRWAGSPAAAVTSGPAVPRGRLARQGHLVLQDRPGRRAPRARPEPRASLPPAVRGRTAPTARMVPAVWRVQQDRRVTRVPLVPRASRDLKGPRDRRVIRDRRAPTATVCRRRAGIRTPWFVAVTAARPRTSRIPRLLHRLLLSTRNGANTRDGAYDELTSVKPMFV